MLAGYCDLINNCTTMNKVLISSMKETNTQGTILMNKPILYISIGALVAFLISAVIVSSFNLVSKKNSDNKTVPMNNSQPKVFTSQSATFEGMITDKKDNMLTLKNINNVTENFPISPSLQITKFGDVKSQPTLSSNPADIELNKNVSIVLNYKDARYEIVNITYIPERTEPIIPPPTKTSSQSGTPSKN